MRRLREPIQICANSLSDDWQGRFPLSLLGVESEAVGYTRTTETCTSDDDEVKIQVREIIKLLVERAKSRRASCEEEEEGRTHREDRWRSSPMYRRLYNSQYRN